ncbi:DUF6998 domain-containing protein [Proteus terrae]|uniref:DUF6998 domain-containing protein n=1 Tax=Proteus terrae TaxID=1574161 RepID=UPI000D69A857|nr:hypothetical protein [Proteus terrae]
MQFDNNERLKIILEEAKNIALEYYKITNKPLGITGEISEYEAARILGLQLCEARQAGYDAIRNRDGLTDKIQIKGRYMPNPKKVSGRLGSIDVSKQFDFVIFVQLDENYDAFAIYEATRNTVMAALEAPGSNLRNIKRQLGIAKFKAISKLIWSKEKEFSSPKGS